MELPVCGGCLCGTVRYQISQPLITVSLCNCLSCRKATGSAGVSWLIIRRENLTFVMGEPRTFKSSQKVIRSFCAQCGTSLTYQSENTPATIDVTTSTLDNPEDYPPTEEVWLLHKLPWQIPNKSIPQYAKDSPE